MDVNNQDELLDNRSELKKKILTMEWDKKIGQITFAKSHQLDECKKELERIEAELDLPNKQE